MSGTGRALDALLARAERAGAARAARRCEAVATEAEALPGIVARIEEEDVVLEGRGLLERWLRDAGLRMLGRGME